MNEESANWMLAATSLASLDGNSLMVETIEDDFSGKEIIVKPCLVYGYSDVGNSTKIKYYPNTEEKILTTSRLSTSSYTCLNARNRLFYIVKRFILITGITRIKVRYQIKTYQQGSAVLYVIIEDNLNVSEDEF